MVKWSIICGQVLMRSLLTVQIMSGKNFKIRICIEFLSKFNGFSVFENLTVFKNSNEYVQ